VVLEKKTTNCKLRAQLAVMLLVAVLGLPATVSADAVTEWNEIATTAAAAANVTGPRHTRAFAMTHAAIHDALNAIVRRYTLCRGSASKPQCLARGGCGRCSA
jgi:hypothetical protein